MPVIIHLFLNFSSLTFSFTATVQVKYIRETFSFLNFQRLYLTNVLSYNTRLDRVLSYVCLVQPNTPLNGMTVEFIQSSDRVSSKFHEYILMDVYKS